jgi:hypothetical protein
VHSIKNPTLGERIKSLVRKEKKEKNSFCDRGAKSAMA